MCPQTTWKVEDTENIENKFESTLAGKPHLKKNEGNLELKIWVTQDKKLDWYTTCRVFSWYSPPWADLKLRAQLPLNYTNRPIRSRVRQWVLFREQRI